jgi:hypothetical protein
VILILLVLVISFLFPEFTANSVGFFFSLLENVNWFISILIVLVTPLILMLFFLLSASIENDFFTGSSEPSFYSYIFALLFVFIFYSFFSVFNSVYIATPYPLKNANRELVAYAQSIGVQGLGCASSPRYGNVLPCTVKMQDKSLYKAFCPWKPWVHGCVLGDNMYAIKSSRELINMEVNAMAMAENKGLSETFNNKFERSNINNFSNKVSDNARQQGNQNIYTNEQKQDLAESAAEIQRLLKQLEESNPTATESEKVAYVNDETTPSLKRRVVKALIAGGESAIEEFLDNPYVNVVKSVIEGWMAAKE